MHRTSSPFCASTGRIPRREKLHAQTGSLRLNVGSATSKRIRTCTGSSSSPWDSVLSTSQKRAKRGLRGPATGPAPATRPWDQPQQPGHRTSPSTSATGSTPAHQPPGQPQPTGHGASPSNPAGTHGPHGFEWEPGQRTAHEARSTKHVHTRIPLFFLFNQPATF